MNRGRSRLQDRKKFEENLSKVREKILELLQRHNKLAEIYYENPSELNVSKYGICIEVMQEEIKLCDLDLQIMETEADKSELKTKEDAHSRIRELEKYVNILRNKLIQQRAVQKRMEESFKEAKQKRLNQLKLLLDELRKYMNTLDAMNRNRLYSILTM